MNDDNRNHAALIDALLDPASWPWPTERVEKIETHISVVLLAGEHALKIKKPVDFGFLDFSTIERRRRFCEEELRLNRRLAPALYLDTVAFTGSPERPVFDGPGEPFEYAVHMLRFDTSMQLDRLLDRGELAPATVDEIATVAARFHEEAARADGASPFGSPEAVLAPMRQNFEQLRPLHKSPDRLAQLDRLEEWTEARFAILEPLLVARKNGGYIRECHGDMHLGNMTMIEGRPVIFDAIEFNDHFRWIDVMSEVAFLTMDLADRGADRLACRFLDGWLTRNGDFEGLRLLRFYQVYRALVRAKVASLRLGQEGVDENEREEILSRYDGYAALAERYTQAETPTLIITHGLSGSGKTTVAGQMVEGMGAVRLRSDIERKRLAGMAATDRPGDGVGEGLYSPAMNEATYDRLADLAVMLLDTGLPIVVDAAFLRRSERDRFARIAAASNASFLIIDLKAPESLLRERITARTAAGGDASDAGIAVLEAQIAGHDPVAAGEKSLAVDSGAGLATAAIEQILGGRA